VLLVVITVVMAISVYLQFMIFNEAHEAKAKADAADAKAQYIAGQVGRIAEALTAR